MAASLLKRAADFEVCALIVGLPLNMDGTEGPRAQATRAFMRNLSKLAPLPFAFWDERLSTAAVTRELIAQDASRAKRAEVEVAALDLGDQIGAEWLPLTGIVYDPKDDLIEVLLEDLDHLIRRPRQVFIDQEAVLLKSVEVIDESGERQIIKLRDPLTLPPPERAQH